MKVTKETPIAALTVSQLTELLEKDKAPSMIQAPQPVDYTKGYVYGLKGIRQLFGVSHATAQRYKDSFLKPAVRQNGRKIVVEVSKALELFDNHKKLIV